MSWEYAKDLCTNFFELKKGYDRVSDEKSVVAVRC